MASLTKRLEKLEAIQQAGKAAHLSEAERTRRLDMILAVDYPRNWRRERILAIFEQARKRKHGNHK